MLAIRPIHDGSDRNLSLLDDAQRNGSQAKGLPEAQQIPDAHHFGARTVWSRLPHNDQMQRENSTVLVLTLAHDRRSWGRGRIALAAVEQNSKLPVASKLHFAAEASSALALFMLSSELDQGLHLIQGRAGCALALE